MLDGCDKLTGWPERVLTMQKNWIGRSEGVEIDFKIDGFDQALKCFTTRIDTIYGATFIALAPEHPLVDKLTSGMKGEKEAAKLKGRYGIGIDDLEDLEQDLHAQVWKKITGEIGPDHPNYRAAVRRTVDSRIKDIIEYRTAVRRKGGIDSISLYQPVKKKKTTESEEFPLFEILDLELFCEIFGDSAPAWHRHRHRKFDVESALNQLPSELRRLADTIDTLNGNMSAVARELRVTRKKLRCDLGKLQQRLRELLED